MDAPRLAPVLACLTLFACRSQDPRKDAALPERPPASMATTTTTTGHEAPPATRPAPETTRYDDLLRHVPGNMESVLVFDLTHENWPKSLRDYYESKVHRGVLAGRKFRFPPREGIGDFEGIMLFEGPATLAPKAVKESDLAFSYATGDVRRTKEEPRLYFTRLGPRRTLYATTEAMMREALRGRGPRGTRLAISMGWPDGVAWESPVVLLRKPDPAIPDERTKEDPRTALWLTTEPMRVKDGEKAPHYRVSHLAMHVTDPAQLEFTARVRLRDPIQPAQLPKHPTLWEMWGGPGFEGMQARVQGDLVLMTGSPRMLFQREGPSIAFLLAMSMVGIRIFI